MSHRHIGTYLYWYQTNSDDGRRNAYKWRTKYT